MKDYETDLMQAIKELKEESIVPAMRVLLALSRCIIFGGIDASRVVLKTQISSEILVCVLDRLTEDLKGWEQSAKTLLDRWYKTEDPWDADQLCMALIELRTDIWGIELLLENEIPETLAEGISKFDQELRKQKNVLSTLKVASTYQSYCAMVHVDCVPWWLEKIVDE